MSIKVLSAVCATVACLTTVAAPTFAEETVYVKASLVNEASGQERINFSGKLRMLSQRIAASSCHLMEGAAAEEAGKLLVAATVEFDKILGALEFGDEDLNVIGAEHRRKTLARVEGVKDAWAPIKAAASAMASGDLTEGNLKVILDGNMPLLAAAQALVTEIVGQYSNPNEMVQADAVAIDVAGRQRMLTQKMSKEACILASGHGNAGTQDDLTKTMQLFEASLYALTSGMPGAGIQAAPTLTIKDGLGTVSEDWDNVKPVLTTILSGDNVPAEMEATKFTLLNKTMVDMNKVVGMYTTHVAGK